MKYSRSRIIKTINIALCLMALALGWIATALQWVDTLGKGFVYAHAGIGVLILGFFLVLLALGQENALQRFGTWFIRCLRYVLAVTFTCLLAFVATKLATVDFYVAYMLLAFGQCMITVDFVGDTKGLEKRIAAVRAQRSAPKVASKAPDAAKAPRFRGFGARKPTKKETQKKNPAAHAGAASDIIPDTLLNNPNEATPETDAVTEA